MIASDARQAEYEKYTRAYAIDTYRMGGMRFDDARNNLVALPCRGSYLDVGCGRGEMLRIAERHGFALVQGVEVVPDLIDGDRVIRGEAHALPFADQSWDVVTLFDVIEHLLPGDDEAVVHELLRVARRHILITAHSLPSTLPDGTELHINRRPSAEWQRLFAAWFAPAIPQLAPCQITYATSPMWRVDL